MIGRDFTRGLPARAGCPLEGIVLGLRVDTSMAGAGGDAGAIARVTTRSIDCLGGNDSSANRTLMSDAVVLTEVTVPGGAGKVRISFESAVSADVACGVRR